MTRRIAVNLAVFLVVGLVLTFWVLRAYVPVGFLQPPTTNVTALFEESPGLQTGFDVTYLGARVGEVGTIELGIGHVSVELLIDPELVVPNDVEAVVKRRSVVGEPYVALDLAADGDPESPRLADGDVIERTRIPLTYETVFRAIEEVLAQLPADDLNTLVSEFADGLDGRVDTIRTLLADTESVTATIAGRTEVLEALTSEVTRFTATIAANADTIGTGLDHTLDVAESLRANRDLITSLLDTSPSLLERSTRLVRDVRPQLECTLASATAIAQAISATAGDDFAYTLSISEQFALVLNAVLLSRDDGDWIQVFGGMPTESFGWYDERLTLPPVPSPATCQVGNQHPATTSRPQPPLDVDTVAGSPRLPLPATGGGLAAGALVTSVAAAVATRKVIIRRRWNGG